MVFEFDAKNREIAKDMKRIILDAILKELERELMLRQGAGERASVGAMYSAPNAEKQRDTTGLEAAYLAHGHAQKCITLARQLEDLQCFVVEDFVDQEIDVGALIEVDLDGEVDWYMLLHCGGGTEVTVDGRLITVITPESPLGRLLFGNVEAGYFTLPSGIDGIVLTVS